MLEEDFDSTRVGPVFGMRFIRLLVPQLFPFHHQLNLT